MAGHALQDKKDMPSEYSPSGSRRSSRRGGRRPSRDNRQNVRLDTPAPKKGLVEKILGFFSPEKKTAAPTPSARTNGSRERGSDKPVRAGRPTGMRKPEQVEVTSARLYVGNLSFDAAESDLLELFSGVGLVQNVEIVMNRHTMKSKGFGFIQMQTIDEAKRAVDELHDKEYMGRKLVVSGAKAVEERRSERTRQPEQ